MKISNILIGLLLSASLAAQDAPVFTVTLSSDTVNPEATFQIIFTAASNQMKDFQAPDFEEFELVYGPNYSSQTTIVNGDMSQKVSYTYGLRALEEGTYAIPSATATINGETAKTDYIKVVVDASYQPKVKPRQQSDFFNRWPRNPFDRDIRPPQPKKKEGLKPKEDKKSKKKKKKRKVYKI